MILSTTAIIIGHNMRKLALGSLLLITLQSSAEASCPVFNGKYVRDLGDRGGDVESQSIEVQTRKMGDAYSYLVKPLTQFHKPDGSEIIQVVDGREFALKIYCRDSTLFMEYKILGGEKIHITSFTSISDSEIRVGGSFESQNGIYKK